ncbi:hypothetical protein PAXRUDRAFT_18742 [Paxillus rubicundulus Ve08.2h10]|uniref:Uncharacterized protein n=1 Tax=Paxillus rubicundulus Ve08.2h10 TaxID=930991 RepID=A0A0D0DE47_9AGAM|nr:hypothetical protein PAXRUDRAFT_18742 [Paxillus rubicundulus Ve08.2h10]
MLYCLRCDSISSSNNHSGQRHHNNQVEAPAPAVPAPNPDYARFNEQFHRNRNNFQQEDWNYRNQAAQQAE